MASKKNTKKAVKKSPIKREPKEDRVSHVPSQDGPVKVKCAYHTIAALEDLVPHPANPNSHGEDQIEMYHAVVMFNGITRPVKVSKRSGYITAGHGLYMMAKKYGIKQLPVSFIEYETEEHEIADMLADNMLARKSLLNTYKATDLLKMLDNGQTPLTVSGFSQMEIERLFVGEALIAPSSLDSASFPAGFDHSKELPEVFDGPAKDSVPAPEEKATKPAGEKRFICPSCGSVHLKSEFTEVQN